MEYTCCFFFVIVPYVVGHHEGLPYEFFASVFEHSFASHRHIGDFDIQGTRIVKAACPYKVKIAVASGLVHVKPLFNHHVAKFELVDECSHVGFQFFGFLPEQAIA